MSKLRLNGVVSILKLEGLDSSQQGGGLGPSQVSGQEQGQGPVQVQVSRRER